MTFLPAMWLAAAALPAVSEVQQPKLGELAPAFSLKDLAGKEVSLADYRGKVVVLHVAATWCPFCNAASHPPPNTQPDLPRDEAMIASNLIIDKEGKIRFFSLLDSANFDAKLVHLTERLQALLSEE